MKRLGKKDIEDIVALTPMQEGMLFHYLRDPESDVYVEQLSLEISGKIDVEVFEKSWNVVVKTNEMLRTVFRWEKLDNPAQVVLKQHNPDLKFFDLSTIEDHVEQQKKLENIKLEDRKVKFDLREVPFRVILCKLSDKDYHIVISNHHILYDGWSSGIILKEFFQAYEALEKGEAEQTTVIKQPFKEFIQWHKKHEQDKQKKFWEFYFKGFDTQTELPIKQKSVKMNKGPGSTPVKDFGFTLEKGMSDRLETFIKKHRVTLAAFFYCAWGILLQKYCGSDDVVFGTTISGRSAPIKGIENMVGLFINTLPLRVTVKTTETLLDLLLEINETLLHREKYENTPLVDIQKYSRRETNQEFFDSLLVMENYPLDLPLTVHSYSTVESTNYDLTIAITLHGGIEVRLIYNEELFEEDVILRLSRHFIRIVNEITVHPRTPIYTIDILSHEEIKQLLLDFNDTAVDYPADKTIHRLFEEQAERTPEQIALTYEGKPMTYHQLNKEASALASFLRFIGVESEEPVASMVDNSHQVIVAILGILKAGGVYVPLNAEYPNERKKYILKDCNAKRLLTNYAGPCDYVLDIMVINPEDGAVYQYPRTEGDTGKHCSNNLAYIMYTSGSTGTPKGVMVEHRSAIRLVRNTNYIEFKEGDSILLTGALEFDASTFEIWGALLNGLTLHLVHKDTKLNLDLLKQAITASGVTTMWMTSPLFNQMLDTDIEIFAGLKNLLVGGDVLSPDHINRVRSRFPELTVINGYGPTENTTFSTTYQVDKEHQENIPIGKPISNSTAYILDRYYHLVPIGVAGELYVGGDGLSRGYLNNPELTTERFIDSPIYSLTHSTLYRTGDLARWLQDGNIEFLGRKDHQVKIRGFRIEPGEIENHLIRVEGIQEAVVVDRKATDGGKYLCAYVVPSEEKVDAVDTMELRKVLSQQLPDYMVPACFVILEKIPLNSNGKVDIKTLPEPRIGGSGAIDAAPGDELERKLAEIWMKVLDLSVEPGINDDFFDLGGHSLKATLLISKMHKELNVKLSLADVLRLPNIRELAAHIKDIKGHIEVEYAAIEPAEEKYYYALSSAQKRLYCLYQVDKGATGYNIPVTVRLEGKLEKVRLEETFKQLIVRHESFRTSFEQVKGEPVQKVYETAAFTIESHEADGFSAVEGIIRNFIRPFDLSQVPLLRVGLVKIEEEHILMVDMHHIISDGTSIGILVQEFMALVEGEELPPLKIQYKDFSEWQRTKKEEETIRKQEAFWLKEFEGGVPVLDLPCDYPRPPERSFEGASIDFELGKEESDALKRVAQEEDVTIYMVLLALFNILMYRLSDQEDIVVGTPVAGRHNEELQHTIGMFVNTLPLRNYPEGRSTFKEFLKDVKERTLRAFENQAYPFEELVENVAPDRDNSRNPLFDVVFVLQNLDIPELRIPGLTLVPYPYKGLATKFDLTMICIEKGDTVCFTLEYSTKLFKPETIERFIRYFKDIVTTVTDDRDIHLSSIKISFYLVEPESALSREAEGHFGF